MLKSTGSQRNSTVWPFYRETDMMCHFVTCICLKWLLCLCICAKYMLIFQFYLPHVIQNVCKQFILLLLYSDQHWRSTATCAAAFVPRAIHKVAVAWLWQYKFVPSHSTKFAVGSFDGAIRSTRGWRSGGSLSTLDIRVIPTIINSKTHMIQQWPNDLKYLAHSTAHFHSLRHPLGAQKVH